METKWRPNDKKRQINATKSVEEPFAALSGRLLHERCCISCVPPWQTGMNENPKGCATQPPLMHTPPVAAF